MVPFAAYSSNQWQNEGACFMSYAMKTQTIMSTLNIGTPELLIMLVLKFEQVHLLMCLKYCWMSGKQCRP